MVRWLGCVLLAACTRTVPQNGGAAEPVAPAPVAEQAAPEASALEAGQETAVVLSAALVRRQPVEARFVPNADKKGRQSNVLTTLYRGEAVRVRARRDKFVDVTLSDESHGWVKEDGLLMGANLQLGTVLAPSRLFTRPDLLALQGSRTVPPGALLVVLRHKDQFSLVNYAGGQCAWLLTALVQTQADEVGAAKLVHRARLLQEREDSGADAVLELLRGQYGSTKLFAALEAAQAVATAAALGGAGEASGPAEVGPENQSADAQGPSPTAAAVADTPSLRLTPPPKAAAAAAAPAGGAPGLQGWQPPPEAPKEAGGAGSAQPSPPDDLDDDLYVPDADVGP